MKNKLIKRLFIIKIVELLCSYDLIRKTEEKLSQLELKTNKLYYVFNNEVAKEL